MKRAIAYIIAIVLLWLALCWAFPGCVMVTRYSTSAPIPISGNRAAVMREVGKYRTIEYFRRNDDNKWYLEYIDTIGRVE